MTNSQQPWMDDSLSNRERAEKLVEAMSLEDKIEQLHGNMEYVDIHSFEFGSDEEMDDITEALEIKRHVKGNDEYGIPRMRVTNGPVGVGMGDGAESPEATALPMTIGLAASFDKNLAFEYGDIIGSETATYGQHVLEGPAVNLHRTPIGGRNFEYFSEDPFLSGVMGVEVTKAIQDHDVIAMGKHFAFNDQEDERFRHNVIIDESVAREMYLLPFEMLVKDADIASIMSAYNRINGVYATEHRTLLNDILRNEWGFDGYVQSDFWSARSTGPSLNAGLDLEMPDNNWFNQDTIKKGLNDTSIEIESVDRALVRRFTQMFRFNQFGKEYNPGEVDAKAHGEIARKIGAQSSVLLKNESDLLPLKVKDGETIKIIGQHKFAGEACIGGGGSSRVKPLYTVAPVEGLKDVLEDLNVNSTVELVEVADDLNNLKKALEEVQDADHVIIMAGLVASEGFDLDSPSLPNDQDAMIAEVLAQRSDAVVVLKDSTPVLMPWVDQANAVLEVWNQGTEDGHVVADLLLGQVNPSGKVPTTYAKREEDLLYYNHEERHPGYKGAEGYPVIEYSEGRNIGYRWYQSQNIEPLFAFGHGLSYTTFELADIEVTSKENQVEINLEVKNTGDVDGAEVVQVYVEMPQDDQPPMRLIAFDKIAVAAGESEKVSLTIDFDATHHPFGVWDVNEHDFVVESGDYKLHIGTASDNIAHVETININQ